MKLEALGNCKVPPQSRSRATLRVTRFSSQNIKLKTALAIESTLFNNKHLSWSYLLLGLLAFIGHLKSPVNAEKLGHKVKRKLEN